MQKRGAIFGAKGWTMRKKKSINTSPPTPYTQQIERNVEEALACPCIADLKDGPCGAPFVAAFSCFLRSQAAPPDAGGAAAPQCLASFDALQACMAQHPAAFAEFVAADGKEKEK